MPTSPLRQLLRNRLLVDPRRPPEHGRAQGHRDAEDPKERRKVIVEADLASLEKMSHVYDSVADAFQKLHEQYSVAELHFLIDYFKQSIATTKIEISKLVTSDE